MEQRVEWTETGNRAEDQQYRNDGQDNLPDAGQSEEAEQEQQQTNAEANIAVKDAFVDRQHDVPLLECRRLAVTLCGSSQRTSTFSIHIHADML